MRSYAAFQGHPIHPALVVVPVGLFVWTFAADIIYLLSDRNQMWYDIAFWSGIAAIVTGAVAAVPGWIDYFMVVVNSDAKQMGLAHGLLNAAVIVLFFIAMLLMLDDGATDGASLAIVVILHGIGVALVSLSGWLGGEMVFKKGIGVSRE